MSWEINQYAWVEVELLSSTLSCIIIITQSEYCVNGCQNEQSSKKSPLAVVVLAIWALEWVDGRVDISIGSTETISEERELRVFVKHFRPMVPIKEA